MGSCGVVCEGEDEQEQKEGGERPLLQGLHRRPLQTWAEQVSEEAKGQGADRAEAAA